MELDEEIERKYRPKCAICGKRLYAFQYNLSEYKYKRGHTYYCCYSHFRKAMKEQEEQNKNRDGRHRFKNIVKRG